MWRDYPRDGGALTHRESVNGLVLHRSFLHLTETDMKLPDSFVDVWGTRALSLLRIVAGFLFMAHGMQKILGFPVARATEVALFSLTGVAGLMELIGGALLILGLFTRPVAFLLSGQMAFAYFIAHAPQGFWPLLNRGELAAL